MLSLWRQLCYQELSKIELTGNLLDLGGSHVSVYHRFFLGEHKFEVANLDDGQDKEYTFNFEESFPLKDASFDGIVCINVLEHIFNYQNLLNESYRILKPGGTMVVAVPFLIRYHPSPSDYWRYTRDTLERIFKEAGYTSLTIIDVGTGPFGVRYSMIHNLLRFSIIQFVCMNSAILIDKFLNSVFKKETLSSKSFPLGYVVIAKKT